MKTDKLTTFSQDVLATLQAQGKSKRWLYLKLEMTAQSFESRLSNNDWRVGEIIKISDLLGL